MLDIRLFRENPEELSKTLATRYGEFPVDDVVGLDARRREVLTLTDELRSERNQGSRQIAELRKSGGDTAGLTERMRLIGEEIRKNEEMISDMENRIQALLLEIPNIPHESVPVGEDEDSNRVVRTWGEPREFDFEPLPHWELGEALGILDFERGVRLAESRFTVLKGLGARLERALVNFMLDIHTKEHAYQEVQPPFMVNSETMKGTGQLPKFAEDLYSCSSDDLWMIPTAEVPLTNLHRGDLEDDLPCATPPTRPASGARRAATAVTSAACFASTSLTRWNWSRSALPRAATPNWSR